MIHNKNILLNLIIIHLAYCSTQPANLSRFARWYPNVSSGYASFVQRIKNTFKNSQLYKNSHYLWRYLKNAARPKHIGMGAGTVIGGAGLVGFSPEPESTAPDSTAYVTQQFNHIFDFKEDNNIDYGALLHNTQLLAELQGYASNIKAKLPIAYNKIVLQHLVHYGQERVTFEENVKIDRSKGYSNSEADEVRWLVLFGNDTKVKEHIFGSQKYDIRVLQDYIQEFAHKLFAASLPHKNDNYNVKLDYLKHQERCLHDLLDKKVETIESPKEHLKYMIYEKTSSNENVTSKKFKHALEIMQYLGYMHGSVRDEIKRVENKKANLYQKIVEDSRPRDYEY